MRSLGLVLLLLAMWCAAGLGCNATCLRDSDCMGTSVCQDNRCLLVQRRPGDAGRPAETTDLPGSSEAPPGGDTQPADAGDGAGD